MGVGWGVGCGMVGCGVRVGAEVKVASTGVGRSARAGGAGCPGRGWQEVKSQIKKQKRKERCPHLTITTIISTAGKNAPKPLDYFEHKFYN